MGSILEEARGIDKINYFTRFDHHDRIDSWYA